jgi:hypothetical protein
MEILFFLFILFYSKLTELYSKFPSVNDIYNCIVNKVSFNFDKSSDNNKNPVNIDDIKNNNQVPVKIDDLKDISNNKTSLSNVEVQRNESNKLLKYPYPREENIFIDDRLSDDTLSDDNTSVDSNSIIEEEGLDNLHDETYIADELFNYHDNDSDSGYFSSYVKNTILFILGGFYFFKMILLVYDLFYSVPDLSDSVSGVLDHIYDLIETNDTNDNNGTSDTKNIDKDFNKLGSNKAEKKKEKRNDNKQDDTSSDVNDNDD